VKVEPAPLNKHQSIVLDEDAEKELKATWTKQFMNRKGFEYIFDQFMKEDMAGLHSTDGASFAGAFKLKHLTFMLKTIRIYVMAAFSCSDPSAYSTVAHAGQHEDGGSNAGEGSRFKELQKLMEGGVGSRIVEGIDHRALQKQVLSLISKTLQKEVQIFEDRLIIENALSLWVGCLLHKKELINDFLADQIEGCTHEDLILRGLLYSKEDKIREDFRINLSHLAHKFS